MIKIGNKDIEHTGEAGIRAINNIPAGTSGKQDLPFAQGFELGGKFHCWDNTESDRTQVLWGYMLKNDKPRWWTGMGVEAGK